MSSYLEKYVPSFWLKNSADADFIKAYLESLQEYSSYKSYNYDAAVKAYACDPTAARKRVPWYPLYLSYNKNTDFQNIRYGGGNVYDGSVVYGQTTKQLFWVLPSGMRDVGIITDSPINPTKVWYPGQYQILDLKPGLRVLLLPISIFDESPRVVETDGDRTLTLWSKQGQWVNDLLFDIHEMPTGFFSTERDEYAALALNAAYKSFSVGPSRETLIKFISGICKLPICIKDGEVSAISATHVVIGDVSYKLPSSGYTLAVQEGDKVSFGEPIINEFKVIYGYDIGSLDSLVMPYIPGSQSHYDVEILNAPETPYIYGTDSDGYTKVSLNSSGPKIEEFWDNIHSLSKSSGTTLAQYLGGVTSPVVPPDKLYPVRALELLASTVLSRSFVISVDSNLVNLENLELHVPKIQDLAGLGSSVYFKVIA